MKHFQVWFEFKGHYIRGNVHAKSLGHVLHFLDKRFPGRLNQTLVIL